MRMAKLLMEMAHTLKQLKVMEVSINCLAHMQESSENISLQALQAVSYLETYIRILPIPEPT